MSVLIQFHFAIFRLELKRLCDHAKERRNSLFLSLALAWRLGLGGERGDKKPNCATTSSGIVS